MKYWIAIGRWGSECVAGEIPEKTWKYIQDECDGDASEYSEKLNDGEVPEEFQLAEDVGSFYEVSGFFDAYAPYSNATLTVMDEDGHEEFMTIDAEKLPKETEYTSSPTGKPYFVWESVEKGQWDVVVETDGPFDKSKLKLHTRKLCYDNDDLAHEFIVGVEYDGEELDVEMNSTDGKAYELDFYLDEEQDCE